MKKFIIILSMVFWAMAFVSCAGNNTGEDPESGESGKEETQCKGEERYTTLTVKANLESGYSIKVEGTEGLVYDVSLSTGQCVKIGCAEGVVVSIEKAGGVFSQLCSNKDDDKDNNCKGSYDVVYKVADPQTGTNKLALESLVVPNESKECVALLPEDEVYTITLAVDLGNRTVKVQNKKKSKTLKGKGSCLKLKEKDFWDLQVDLGEGDENRHLLCSNKEGAVAKRCGAGDENKDETNFEVALRGQPPNHNAVVLNVDTEYNNSESCEWLSE